MSQGGEGIIRDDEHRVTFLSNDDIKIISPTKDVLLNLERRHMQTHIPGSKVHERHFCLALEEEETIDSHYQQEAE